jgi:uncharacterized protein YhhL (DUF1145 family)
MDSEQQLLTAKMLIAVVWVLAFASFFPPVASSTFAVFGQSVFWILAAAHAIECLVFAGLYRRTSEPLMMHFCKTMAFGVIHKTEVQRQIDSLG